VAEVRLARFVEEMVVPPNMIDTIVDGEVGTLIYSLLFVYVMQNTIEN
jgi:hypothetical protein